MFLSPFWIKHHVVAILFAAMTVGFVCIHPQAVQAVDLVVSAPAPGATQTFSSGTQTYEGLIVGNNSGEIGTLNIESGVTFNTGAVGHNVLVGNLLGSTGTVNLSGAGTTWTDVYYATTIGQYGTGALNVDSGAKVNIYALNVGYQTGGTGSVSLTGSGSYLKTQSGVTFGYGGNPATLSITNGAGLETVLGSLYMKHGASLTLDGVGSSLRVGTLHSGTPTDWTTADGWFSPEKATINVSGGAYLETDGCYLIGGSDGAAVMTLTGSGTQMDAHLLIYVGGDGNGQPYEGRLTISAGATANASSVAVGVDTGSTGTLLVTGPGSILSTQSNNAGFYGNVYAGSYGNGHVTIEDGAILSASGQLRVGFFSKLVSGSLVGSVGVLDITSGATVSSGILSSTYGPEYGNAYGTIIGGDAATTGTVNVSGANTAWTDYGLDGILVGKSGSGTLNITNGARVTATNLVVAQNADGVGSVTVSGAGSSLTASDELVIGSNGVAELTVANGGIVSNAHEGTVGHQAGSTGRVTVTGLNSKWTNGSELVVGWSGTGEMTVENGGTVSNTNGFIGARAGGSGTVTVTGPGSTWESSSQLILGYEASTGALTIANGGKVINSDGRIGLSANSIGTVTVTGANSTLTDNGSILRIGYDGTGTLTIANGGLVTVGTETNGAYDGVLTIASNAGSSGTLNIGAAAGSSAAAAGTLKAASIAFGSGTGTIVFNHTDTGLTFSPAISGAGTVKVLSGTTVLTGANTYSGDTTISGGTLKAGGTNVFSANSAVTVNTSGTLDLAGYDQTIAGLSGVGAVTLGSGTLTVNNSANNSFGGTISGTGGLTKSGSGVLALSGTNTYSGATTVNAGTLQAGAANAFSPYSAVTVNAGGILDLNNYAQTIAGLSGAGSVTLGSAALTVNTAAGSAYAFSGVIADSGAGGSLVKSGAGTLTLSGANTYPAARLSWAASWPFRATATWARPRGR